MTISEFIQSKLESAALGWQGKQTQIDNVRQEVERLQTQVQELQTAVTAKTPTALEKVFESRGK